MRVLQEVDDFRDLSLDPNVTSDISKGLLGLVHVEHLRFGLPNLHHSAHLRAGEAAHEEQESANHECHEDEVAVLTKEVRGLDVLQLDALIHERLCV